MPCGPEQQLVACLTVEPASAFVLGLCLWPGPQACRSCPLYIPQVPESHFAGVQQWEWEEGIAWAGGADDPAVAEGGQPAGAESEHESEDEQGEHSKRVRGVVGSCLPVSLSRSLQAES